MPIQTVKPENWKPVNLPEGIVIDVRTQEEHTERHLKAPHAHAPLDTLDPVDVMLRHGLGKNSAVHMLCRGGKRATTAAQKFEAAGFTNITVIEGGLTACETAGIPTEGTAEAVRAYCAIPTKTGSCN